MSLNLHHLRVFAAVAEAGSFTRAAAALRLSQPAVSKSVQELEREVGLSLIERAGRASRLTAAGETLAARARELFNVETSAEEELRSLRSVDGGSLRVGASTTIATYMLPTIFARFQSAHPGVTLRVVSANTRAIARQVLERRLDIALVEGPVTHPLLDVIPWRDDELVLIAHPDSPFVRRRKVRVQDLAEERLIIREAGSGTREVTELALLKHGVKINAGLQLGSTEAVKQAVAAGLGMAVVSKAAAVDQLALGRIAVVRLERIVFKRKLAELRLKGRKTSASATAFLRYLRPSK